MYQYQPKRENKTASVLLLVLALASVITVGVSVFTKAFAGILQTAAVLMLAAEVALFIRYFRKTFVYRIQNFGPEGTSPDLVVSEVTGKDNIIVCRLSLDDLYGIKKRTENKNVKGRKKYNYCIDIAPKNAFCLEFTDCGTPVTVIISPDEKMLSILGEYLKRNSENDE